MDGFWVGFFRYLQDRVEKRPSWEVILRLAIGELLRQEVPIFVSAG
jgi:hypothetical protein